MVSIAANSQAAMAPRIVSLANAAQQPYVSELLSYTLDRLHKEPELLRVDAERLKRQMQEVAVGHYRAFITAADALQSVGEEVSSIDKHLELLIAEAPKLSNGCNEFMDSAQQILEKRRLNHTLLANHNTLLDLLEIPQLMDTCVRNGNYDEALDLEGFVSKLATMHPKLPVIQSLSADVKQTTQSMLSQLLQRLRSNIQLPECLRVIGYLRRLGVFNEQEMRLQFLRCREAWLMGIIDDLDQGNVSEFLKRMADCHRVHLFDVVTQYRAIFADDTSGNEENYDGGLLFSWAMHRITSHLNVLQIMLPKITEGAALANILDQCMYCAMSLGWVGLDFRGLLPPLFEASMHNLFVRNMAATIENFQLVLDSHRWVPLPLVKFVNRGNTDETDDGMAPPDSLMEHPPLAMFVNGILATLNELRYCAPINLKAVLALELVRTFQAISDYLVLYNRTRVLRESESTLFLAMCRAFIEVACPYCIRCFSRSYPGGINSTELNKSLEGVYNLVGNMASSPAVSSILNETSGTQRLPTNHNSLDSRKQALEDNFEDRGSNVLENGGTANSENGERTPCEVLKQRLQVGMFDNVGAAFIGTWKQDGMKGFFRGAGAMLFREVPFYVAGMGLYAESTKVAQQLANRELAPWEIIAVGALSGGLAAVLTTPFDVMKTRMMTAPPGEPTTIVAITFTILKQDGPLGLFKGAVPRFFWIAPLGAMNFAGYELAKKALDKADDNVDGVALEKKLVKAG